MNRLRDLCSIVNTHSTYADVFHIFLKSYFHKTSNIPLYSFSDKFFDFEADFPHESLIYKTNNFRDQYLECLQDIPFDYILTFNDDYFLNGAPNFKALEDSLEILQRNSFGYIRYVRGPNFTNDEVFDCFYRVDATQPYAFSQTLTMWRKSDLTRIFEKVGPSGIARKSKEPQFEVLANQVLCNLGINGLVYYSGEKKVGKSHFECSVIPHIVSAVVDGYWNTSEYRDELKSLELKIGHELSKNRFKNNWLMVIKQHLYECIKRPKHRNS